MYTFSVVTVFVTSGSKSQDIDTFYIRNFIENSPGSASHQTVFALCPTLTVYYLDLTTIAQ